MKHDNSTLRLVGEALYGPSWQTPLSDALGVADRTIRRWVAGDFEIPAGIWDELANLCDTRGTKLQALADKLRGG